MQGDAPERIWSTGDGKTGSWNHEEGRMKVHLPHDWQIEYIRADVSRAAVEAVEARLAEVEAERDAWMADSAAAWDKCEERRLLQEAAEAKLAKAMGALDNAASHHFATLCLMRCHLDKIEFAAVFDEADRAVARWTTTLAEIGEGHE